MMNIPIKDVTKAYGYVNNTLRLYPEELDTLLSFTLRDKNGAYTNVKNYVMVSASMIPDGVLKNKQFFYYVNSDLFFSTPDDAITNYIAFNSCTVKQVEEEEVSIIISNSSNYSEKCTLEAEKKEAEETKLFELISNLEEKQKRYLKKMLNIALVDFDLDEYDFYAESLKNTFTFQKN